MKIIKTYFINGTSQDLPYFLEDSKDFYIQELECTVLEKYLYPGDSIKYDLDSELVLLYDTLRDMFFEDTNEYYRHLGALPIFVQEAGQNSNCQLTSKMFSERIQTESFKKIPNIYRYLYLVDCQFLIGTIQNLLSGMEDIFTNFYIQLSNIGTGIKPYAPDDIMFEVSQSVRFISSALESYFIKAYSILDIICKIGYEIDYPMSDFSSYKKTKSADILWGDRKKLQINGTERTLFERCEIVSIIEALRNEVVHNGTWELNPKVFIKYENEKIVERYMLFPDIEQGHLATVKSRKHFFGNVTKVNEILITIHMQFQRRLLETVKLYNTQDAK